MMPNAPPVTPTIRAVLVILCVSVLIALVAPFDTYFARITGGSPLARGVVMALMVLVGAAGARLGGLTLALRHGLPSLKVGIVAAVGVAVYVVVLDVGLFRSLLSPSYVAALHQPLGFRYLYFFARAFNENVIYRLFVFGMLAALVRLCRKGRAGGFASMLVLATITQCVNIGANVVLPTHGALTPVMLAYDALRYIAPGVLWAVLYWRHGFACAEVASVGCHLFLQPAFSVLL